MPVVAGRRPHELAGRIVERGRGEVVHGGRRDVLVERNARGAVGYRGLVALFVRRLQREVVPGGRLQPQDHMGLDLAARLGAGDRRGIDAGGGVPRGRIDRCLGETDIVRRGGSRRGIVPRSGPHQREAVARRGPKPQIGHGGRGDRIGPVVVGRVRTGGAFVFSAARAALREDGRCGRQEQYSWKRDRHGASCLRYAEEIRPSRLPRDARTSRRPPYGKVRRFRPNGSIFFHEAFGKRRASPPSPAIRRAPACVR